MGKTTSSPLPEETSTGPTEEPSVSPMTPEKRIALLEASIRSLSRSGHGTTDLRIEKEKLEEQISKTGEGGEKGAATYQ